MPRYAFTLIHNSINCFASYSDSFIPAEIASPETSVKMGSDVDLQCTSLKLPERNQKGNVYAYLYKNGYTVQNGNVIQMNIWDTVKNKARFTLKEVTMRDAGTYFCFLMSEPCTFPKEVHGINEVNLNITEYVNETLKITLGCSSLLLLIILSLGLWGMFHKQGCFKCHSERSTEHRNDSRDAELDQGEMQNEQSFGTEWEDSEDSASASLQDIYQVSFCMYQDLFVHCYLFSLNN
ncbi:uncharacterized protein LOC108264748 isoform X3 [Ictalurus punctatus]|uniref:Uncharacterized protein LOC108264748 isoform X3 n=1 Tax=Ictalurus punctatus TaxID=7998 RepID=A0A9F7R2A6_ICTPU|nr:uncharacterized protein LOC108264748 isoform X3 [Ictalurus punctatus]